MQIDKNFERVPPEHIEEKIVLISKTHKEQILTLTQLLNQLIYDVLVKTTPAVGSLTHRPHTEPSFNRRAGTSPDMVIGSMGLHPTIEYLKFGERFYKHCSFGPRYSTLTMDQLKKTQKRRYFEGKLWAETWHSWQKIAVSRTSYIPNVWLPA